MYKGTMSGDAAPSWLSVCTKHHLAHSLPLKMSTIESVPYFLLSSMTPTLISPNSGMLLAKCFVSSLGPASTPKVMGGGEAHAQGQTR